MKTICPCDAVVSPHLVNSHPPSAQNTATAATGPTHAWVMRHHSTHACGIIGSGPTYSTVLSNPNQLGPYNPDNFQTALGRQELDGQFSRLSG